MIEFDRTYIDRILGATQSNPTLLNFQISHTMQIERGNMIKEKKYNEP